MPAHASEPQAGSAAVHALRRAASWVLGLVLLAGTATALGVTVYPVVTGGSALAVLSGSMTPGLPVGAMVFTRPVDPATIAPGDVITFQRAPDGPELVTHRVIAVDTTGPAPVFTTQGDANDAPDLDPVPASAVRGELWFGVDHLGRLAAVLHSPKGVGLLILLVCGVMATSPGPRQNRTPTPDRLGEGTADAEEDDARTVLIAPAARPPVPDPPARGTTSAPLPPRPVGLLD
ncbi:MAG TPA: signal peptidase I [Geodermatophilus sp.]|nr:signal peptidase I [Geodermatophilus sp.]